MSKIIIPIIVISVVFGIASCSDPKNQTEKDIRIARSKSYRSVTVINKTPEKLVKECTLMTADGTPIVHQKEKKAENIVFLNFDPKQAFKNETQFKIILTDRYDLKYEKEFTANNKGNTNVVVEESDQVKQPGNSKKKIERILNRREE